MTTQPDTSGNAGPRVALVAGVAATMQPWLLVTVVGMTILYARAAYIEEERLAASALAATFADYRKRTGMFVPLITARVRRG